MPEAGSRGPVTDYTESRKVSNLAGFGIRGQRRDSSGLETGAL